MLHGPRDAAGTDVVPAPSVPLIRSHLLRGASSVTTLVSTQAMLAPRLTLWSRPQGVLEAALSFEHGSGP